MNLFDEDCVKYLTNFINKSGKVERQTAKELALSEYAAFLGLQYLFPDGKSKQMEHFIARLTEIISCYCEQQNN